MEHIEYDTILTKLKQT